MSISMLEALHVKLKQFAESDLNSKLRDIDDEDLSKQSTVAKHARVTLNKSIHIVEKSLIASYLREYDSSISQKEVDLYYKTIKNNISNYLDIMYNGGGAFIILKKGVTIDTASIEIIQKIVKGIGATNDEWVNNVVPFIPKNGYEVFNRAYIKASQYLLDNGTLSNEFESFLISSKNAGHSASSSNINFFMGTIISSILSVESDSGYGIKSKSRTAKEFIELNKAEIFAEFSSLMKGSSVNKKKLFEYFLDTQMTYLRKVDKNGITANLTIDFTNPNISDLVKELSTSIHNTATSLAPQNAAINQQLGREIESQVSRYLHKFYEASHKVMSDTFTKRIDKKSLLTLKGSKSIKELISDQIVLALSNKPLLNTNIKTKTKDKPASTPKLLNKTKKPKSYAMNTKQAIHKSNLPQLRNLRGQFTSLTSLQNLLNLQLHDQIKKNMQRPNLKYQTGRFAKSVKVEHLSRARDGAITAFMSYMRYPYATFEVGGKQGHKGYYPSRLINTSVRELAAKLVKEKFTSITIK